jgi:hypothetical protein
LTLGDLLRLRANEPNQATRRTSVILVWLGGGPSHIDMYDMKPSAPAEFRGDFREAATNVAGVRMCELLPAEARIMDKLAIVRSVTHTNPGHSMGSHWMMTGYVPTIETSGNLQPSAGSVAARMRGANAERMPGYVCVPNPPGHAGAAYLGVAYNPFTPGNDPNGANFEVRDLRLAGGIDLSRFRNRQELLHGLDRIRRDFDAAGNAEGYDRFYREAFEIVTSPQCREAFDISRERDALRDKYGRHTWGQSALLARRLVQAGVTFVTVNMGGWDTHQNNFSELRTRKLAPYDQAVAALVEDIYERGLDRDVLVVTYGEFGRTPRINNQAGRDHWPGAMSVLFSGGGLRMGQTVGSTDSRAEYPTSRAFGPQDVLATMYHVLGIDYRHEFRDAAQRPFPILNQGRPIQELVG